MNPTWSAAALSLTIIFMSTVTGQQPRTREPEKRMEAVQQLKLARLPGGMLPTFYSEGAKPRALYLQTFISGERDFYQQALLVPLSDLNLAVLNPEDWSPVTTRDPYGMPSVH